MARAVWNGATLAESDETIVVEGNHYFPRESVRSQYIRESDTTTVCPWKGVARYYHLEVEGQTSPDAAWYYPEPKPAGSQVANRIAFWKGVEVEA
ncbi:MAG: DUF427 domain-containing protein [Thermoanaerobaculia bacterium]